MLEHNSENTMALHVGYTFWYVSLPFSAKTATWNDKIQSLVENGEFSFLYLNLKRIQLMRSSVKLYKLNKLRYHNLEESS